MRETDPEEWKRWFVPGVVPVTILEIAAERGVDPDALLDRAGIDVPASEIFESGLTFGQHAELVRTIEKELRDPALGVEIGWRLLPTALGSVGFAILASGTLGDALALLQRFWHLVGRASTLTIDTDSEIASVAVDVTVAIGNRDVAFIKEVTIVSMAHGAFALAPEHAEHLEVWFDYPEPPHGALVRERLGRVRYGMPASQLRFPAHLLSTKLAMSNPIGLRAAVKWCEREERMRGLSEERVSARVQNHLVPGANGYPSLEETAKKLAMAPRTLRRHLADEGTRFSALLEAARRRDALRLLETSGLAAHEVAAMLGYENGANFTRAF
ncbi:MAG: AraC family transcriptional regulator ligand-binding domain-containing protein, partial [Sandaracinaceae bacterium]